MLKALVVEVSEAQKQGRARDMKEILNIAGSLVKKKEKVEYDVPILDLFYCAKLGVYVCVYEVQSSVRMSSPGRSGEGKKVKSE